MKTGQRFNVPAWLDVVLPETKPAIRIKLGPQLGEAPRGLVAQHPDGSTSPLPQEIERGYDMVGGDGADVTFSKGVRKRYSHKRGISAMRSVFVPVDDGTGNMRMLLSFTDADRVRVLESAWAQFLEFDRCWRRNPTFYNAFQWLGCHPVFWTRSVGHTRPGDEHWQDSMFWLWQTDGYVPEVTVYDDRAGTVVALEAGAHVHQCEHWDHNEKIRYLIGDVYTEHYHDLRLDVHAKTYEKAVRKLARRVDKFFEVDGSEKTGVSYAKSKLEKKLDKIVAEGRLRQADSWPTVHILFSEMASIKS
ncbi:MAG: hypothetical protein LBE83_01720 [Propionibacteriaceae bacterium]|jgi:hypothetical protein|nr:hypothetical protein [Propionibacteriaceae bacterium]